MHQLKVCASRSDRRLPGSARALAELIKLSYESVPFQEVMDLGSVVPTHVFALSTGKFGMRIGPSFEAFAELRMRPRARADPAFHEAAEMTLGELFPINTISASGHLRRRGYDARPEMLEILAHEGVIVLSTPDVWSQADVDLAAEYFDQWELLVPYSAECSVKRFSYADYLHSLRAAAAHKTLKYGRRVFENDQYFVLHRIPPHGLIDPAGKPATTLPAKISFMLLDDVRAQLERG